MGRPTGGTPDTALLAHYTALAGAARQGPGADATATSAPARRRRAQTSSPTAGEAPSSGRDRRPQPLRRRAHGLDPGRRLPPGRHRARAPVRRGQRGGRRPRRRRRRGPRHARPDGADCVLATGTGRPHSPRGADRPPRDRRGRRDRLDRLERGRRRRRVRRLGQPAVRAAATSRRTRRPSPATTFTITGLANARSSYVVVRARDAAGNASAARTRSSALPHLTIGWANLQWPPTLTHTISAVNRTDNVYGQVWIDGVTSQPGADAGPASRSSASGRTARTRPGTAPGRGSTPAFNTDAGNNDEFVASLLPDATGSLRLRLPLHRRPTAATGSTPTSTASATAIRPTRPAR